MSEPKKVKQNKNKAAEQNNKRSNTRSARLVALDILVKVEESKAYSNLQLNRTLTMEQLTRQDASLVTELVYGTISRKLTLDYWLQSLVAKGFHKLQPWVLQLLRMSLYQLIWLDRIPEHAIVNEAVNIAKKKGHQGISGMVNGILRNVIRNKEQYDLASIKGKNDIETLSLRYSFPAWLVESWLAEYGYETTEAILHSSNTSPHSSIRVNRMITTVEEVIAELAQEGLDGQPSSIASVGINVERGGHLASLAAFKAGKFSMQDESSMLVAEVLQPKPGMMILDACAAPGGKSMHIGELMNGEGTLISNDLHEHKAQLIAEQALRLKLPHIKAISGDATLLPEQFKLGHFDAILLDAPCSGFGVIRRKPEIKWTKSKEDVTAIAAIQSRLLEAMSGLVRSGGTLVYSTCTIAKEENEQQIASFLARHPEFKLDAAWPKPLLARLKEQHIIDEHFDGQLQLLPHHASSDGFYIARLVKS